VEAGTSRYNGAENLPAPGPVSVEGPRRRLMSSSSPTVRGLLDAGVRDSGSALLVSDDIGAGV
jgi:hypothetical protein